MFFSRATVVLALCASVSLALPIAPSSETQLASIPPAQPVTDAQSTGAVHGPIPAFWLALPNQSLSAAAPSVTARSEAPIPAFWREMDA